MKPYNIVFFGTPQFVIPILQVLLSDSNFNITSVFTQPDQPLGRKQILTPSPIKQYAWSTNISVFTPQKLNTDEFKSQLYYANPSQPDLAILAAYGKIIPKWLLEYPKHGFLNIHPSLLPKYRGATPTLGPLIRGEQITGVSYMFMDEQLDHGPILAQTSNKIYETENRDQLTTRLFQEASRHLTEIIKHYLEYQNTQQLPTANTDPYQLNLPSSPQDHNLATFTPLLTKNDGFLPWELIQAALDGKPSPLTLFPAKLQPLISDLYTPQHSATFIHQTITALAPWPGAWTEIVHQNQTKRLKLLSSQLIENHILLNQVQLEGKTPQSWESLQSSIKI